MSNDELLAKLELAKAHLLNQRKFAMVPMVQGAIEQHVTSIEAAIKALSSATEEKAIGHARYEYVRTLSPRQFAALYDEALHGDRFDDLVDRYRDAGEKPE